MTSSTTLQQNFTADTVTNMLFNALSEVPKLYARFAWNIIQSILIEWWPWIIGFLFIAFIIAVTRALMGRWGALAGLIYNSLYFGVFLIIVIIVGSEIFITNGFSMFTALILYPILYLITGFIIDKIGIKKL
jgi:hypothetical protein